MSEPDFDKLPPMLKLYREYKSRYGDALILMQVGDFYEAFFEDAVTISKILSLTLTSRDKSSPSPIPMCGVPISSIDNYLERLVSRGYSAALIRQLSDSETIASSSSDLNDKKNTDKKGMVKRALERLVSPGMRVLGSEQADRETIYLAALGLSRHALSNHSISNSRGAENDNAIVYADLKEGVVYVRDGIARQNLLAEVERVRPSELLIPKEIDHQPVDKRTTLMRSLERIISNEYAIKQRSSEAFQHLLTQLTKLSGFSGLSKAAKDALLILAGTVHEASPGASLQFTRLELVHDRDLLVIDSITRRHLELTRNLDDGGTNGTLFSVLDCTSTAQGARLLKRWILEPLCSEIQIKDRQDVVENFISSSNSNLLQTIKTEMRYLVDFERLSTRLELLAINPRELAALRDSLLRLDSISSALRQFSHLTLIDELLAQLTQMPELKQLLLEKLSTEPPANLAEGYVIKDGYSSELDRLRKLKSQGSEIMAQIEAREKERTGIQSLKVRFNNIFGYYIEITKANLGRTPSDYIRKQTTVNSERFITPELKQHEEEITNAQDKILALERSLFEQLRLEVSPYLSTIRALGAASAKLDTLLSLAQVAERDNWIRPELCEQPILNIKAGRHPVLHRMIGDRFIANSLELGVNGCIVLTGPNMGGKSTFLRQAALIVILAQLGSFVPAKYAQIGIVSKIFTRIGASDNMREGSSTFMLEMQETAHILAQADQRSLVIIDEVGRGTATQDGLALAQAILEWIISHLRCRTLFATHFHEITRLDQIYPELKNLSVSSVDQDGEVVFTHEIKSGPANKSYGLEVGLLAGLPAKLVDRARSLLETNARGVAQKQLTLFDRLSSQIEVCNNKSAEIKEPEDYKHLKQLEAQLKGLRLNELTPIQALNILDNLKAGILN